MFAARCQATTSPGQKVKAWSLTKSGITKPVTIFAPLTGASLPAPVKTHTKLFREEVERPVLIATDLGDTMNFGSQLLFKSLQASHLAALLAWNAKARGDRIGGIVFNQYQHSELKPRSRQQGVLHYLHALHEGQNQSVSQQLSLNQTNASQPKPAQQTGHDYFAENCARLRQLARPGSLVYLITDGYQLSENCSFVT